jgi:DNA-binding IclR family transcriptional regulator
MYGTLMRTVQSVLRSIALLEEVAHHPRGLVDLAEAAELPTTTAARLLSTLESAQALSRDDDGVYRIGPTITWLAAAGDLEPSLRDLARPYMAELVGAVDEAVGLSIPVGDSVATIAQIDAPRPVQAQDWYGTRWPLLGGGSGFVLLATWPEEEVARVVGDSPAADRALAGIARARRVGVSWSHGDYVAELSSVAAPILGRSGRAIAALYVYGPSYRFPAPGSEGDVALVLRDVAGRVSRAWALRGGTEDDDG